MDPVRLELGYGLLGLIGDGRGAAPAGPDQGAAPPARGRARLRHAVGADPGQHPAAGQHLRHAPEGDRGRARRHPRRHAAGDGPAGPADHACPGEATTEPTFGLPAMWIVPGLRDEAVIQGLTVVDPATVVTTHLTEVVRENLADLLSYAETQKLLGELPAGVPEAAGRAGPRPDHDGRHPARAAGPAGRADLDPRPAVDPGGDRRGAWA